MRYNYTYYLLVVFFSLVLWSCTDLFETEQEVTPEDNYLIANKLDVKTFEMVTISKTQGFFRKENYQGNFGGEEVELIKSSDESIAFIVPDLESGSYILDFGMGVFTFLVTKTIVNNPKTIVSDVFNSFNTNINSIPDLSEEDHSMIEDAISFKDEVEELFQSLTEDQKIMVAGIYESNKNIFDSFRQSIHIQSPAHKEAQVECLRTDSKSYYSCRANNLANSGNELKNSSKEFATLLGLAGLSAYLAPTNLVSAGTTVLALGVASYILLAEIKPHWIVFRKDLREFAEANWIFAIAIFEVIQDEFSSNEETDLGLNAGFRTIKQSDYDVSEETNLFLTSYNKLIDEWYKVSTFFGDIPRLIDDEEKIELNAVDIVISDISNPNVELVSQSGENVVFKSTDGYDQFFDFIITVNKEGFTDETIVSAHLISDSCEITNAPVISNISVSCDDSSLGYLIQIEFVADGIGFSPSGSYYGVYSQTAYPVKIDFLSGGTWQHSANGYYAQLISGNSKAGVIEIAHVEATSSSCKKDEYYDTESKWFDSFRISIMNDCLLESNFIEFDLIYYSHTF